MAAPDKRQPGSDRGRPACDWEQAFVYWAALPSEQRSYAAVAAEFKVSTRTVERHGRLERWQQRLNEINKQAAAETDARLGQEKAEEASRLRKLIEATMVSYADKLRRGDVRISPSDLDRLHKLLRKLDDELAPAPSMPRSETAAPVRSVEHVAAVVQALAESGALAQLGLQIVPEDDDPDNNNDDEGGS
jgi:hypothetical protein